MTDAEQSRLVAALDGARSWEERRDRVLFLTMLWTGIRIGSALALLVGDVNLDAAVIAIRAKGGVRATLPLAPTVVELLAEWLPDEGPVFPSRSGAALSPRQAQARLASWCKRAGIRTISPHSLRHAFAQRLLRQTGSLAIVQRALTHRSIMRKVVYAQADDSSLRAALLSASAFSRRGDAVLARQIGHLRARLRGLQDPDDLEKGRYRRVVWVEAPLRRLSSQLSS